MNRKLYCALVLCTFAVSTGTVCAIPTGETVKKNAEDIFSRPEFARLQKINRARPGQQDFSRQGPDGGGNGNGRNRRGDGPERGDDRERGPQNDGGDNNDFNRDRRMRDNPPQQQGQTSSRSSASFGDFGAGMAGLFKLLGWLAIGIMIAVIVIMIVKSIQDRESRLEQELTGTFVNDVGELDVAHPPSEFPSDEYLRRAAEFARQGAFRDAVAFVLLGAMSEVESRGFIRYRKGLTQRDYYRTVRKHGSIGPAYRSLLKIYEPLGFGRRTAEMKHYQTAVKSFRGGFRDGAAVSEI